MSKKNNFFLLFALVALVFSVSARAANLDLHFVTYEIKVSNTSLSFGQNGFPKDANPVFNTGFSAQTHEKYQ